MSPRAARVVTGASINYSLTVRAINGFNGTVNFAVSGLPSGVSGSFNPVSITGSGSTTLTINTSASAAAGNYTITVNATSGLLSHNATASLSVTNMPALSILKTHSGNFTQGQQNATYTVTVSNAADAAPTSGMVTVTETIPSGLTLVAMTGSGWSCAGNTCSRSDVLAPGASYPAIAAMVNVAGNATSPQVNQVSFRRRISYRERHQFNRDCRGRQSSRVAPGRIRGRNLVGGHGREWGTDR